MVVQKIKIFLSNLICVPLCFPFGYCRCWSGDVYIELFPVTGNAGCSSSHKEEEEMWKRRTTTMRTSMGNFYSRPSSTMSKGSEPSLERNRNPLLVFFGNSCFCVVFDPSFVGVRRTSLTAFDCFIAIVLSSCRRSFPSGARSVDMSREGSPHPMYPVLNEVENKENLISVV